MIGNSENMEYCLSCTDRKATCRGLLWQSLCCCLEFGAVFTACGYAYLLGACRDASWCGCVVLLLQVPMAQSTHRNGQTAALQEHV